MFTGLIQRTGTLRTLRIRGSGCVATIIPDSLWEDDPLVLGESVAVNGACLTVSTLLDDGFEADILAETLRCTTFAEARIGDRVNLERALRLGDRLGGHYVSGHVDEVGILLDKRPTGADFTLRIGCSTAFAIQTIMKGSVSLAGISLTISGLGDTWFEVSIIPTTLRDTLLGSIRNGDKLNLESDLLGKYVQRQLTPSQPSGITMDTLIAAGF